MSVATPVITYIWTFYNCITCIFIYICMLIIPKASDGNESNERDSTALQDNSGEGMVCISMNVCMYVEGVHGMCMGEVCVHNNVCASVCVCVFVCLYYVAGYARTPPPPMLSYNT